MAELVDALVSGTSIRKYVQVRVLFWALNEGADDGNSLSSAFKNAERMPGSYF